MGLPEAIGADGEYVGPLLIESSEQDRLDFKKSFGAVNLAWPIARCSTLSLWRRASRGRSVYLQNGRDTRREEQNINPSLRLRTA